MVFVNTKRVAEKLEGYLIANGFKAQALSGDVPQKKRLRFMKEFHSGELAVLICTDVASRGLHIADVSHVFNYDLPQDAADYVHRIGRTARAGAEGDAISFGCEEYAVSLPEIEAYITHKIPVCPVKLELLARDLKPPVYKEWDPEDGPKPMRRPGGGVVADAVVRGVVGPVGGGGRGGPPRRSGSGGRWSARGGRTRRRLGR